MASNLDTGGSNLRRQVLSIILIGCVLVGAWVTYVAVSALIFQPNAYEQQGMLSEAENINAEQIPIAFPNFSLPDNFMDLFNLDGSGDMEDEVFGIRRHRSRQIDDDSGLRRICFDG